MAMATTTPTVASTQKLRVTVCYFVYSKRAAGALFDHLKWP